MSRRVAWVAVWLCSACTCSHPTDNVVGTGAHVSAMIGPAGGTLTLEGLELTIPKDALTATVAIELDSTRDEPPPQLKSHSPIFRLLPAGTQFQQPVLVKLTVPTADEQTMFWSDSSGVFQVVSGAPHALTVVGQSLHFSDVFAGEKRTGLNCHSDQDCADGLLCYTPDGTRVQSGAIGGCNFPRNEDDARTLRAAPQCTFGPGSLPRETIGDNVGTKAPLAIQYVFVLMMENRSFDHYFGRFQAYLNDPRRYVNPLLTHYSPPPSSDDPRLKPFDATTRDSKGRPLGVDVPGKPYDQLTHAEQDLQDQVFDPRASSADLKASPDAPYNPVVAGQRPTRKDDKHYWRHAGDAFDPVTQRWKYLPSQPSTCFFRPNDVEQCVSDTCHEWWCTHMEWNSGRMDGFFQANDAYWEGGEPIAPDDVDTLNGDRALFYEDWNDIPFYYWLADTFAMADHYHASALGPTWVNRDYLYAATSRGVTCNASDDYGGGLDTAWVYAGDIPANPPTIAALYPGSTAPKPINTLYEDLVYLTDTRFTQWTRARYVGAPLPRFGTWYDPLAGLAGYTLGPASNNPAVLAGTSRGAIRIYDATVPNDTYTGIAVDYAKSVVDWLKSEVDDVPGFEASVAAEEALLEQARANGTAPQLLVPQGKLNAVNFIDPDKLEDVNGEDEHPPAPPRMGQRLTWDVVRVLMKNPEVWKRSALFITYDENGGFYDHVKPPPACKPDNLAPGQRSVYTPLGWSGAYGGTSVTAFSDGKDMGGTLRTADGKPDHTDPDYGGDFDRYGVRVPLMVISPWAKHSYVSHDTYDHTSIVRFIEMLYDLPALTRRDANADPMLDLFDFTNINSKLAGTYKDANGNAFGDERLPTGDPVFADVEVNYSIDPHWNATANVACLNAFTPLLSPSPFDDLGQFVYGSYDWSPGKKPPCNYDASRDDVAVCGDVPDAGEPEDAGFEPETDGGTCGSVGFPGCDVNGVPCCHNRECANVSNDCSVGVDPFYECTASLGEACDEMNGHFCNDYTFCVSNRCCDVGLFYVNKCELETTHSSLECKRQSDCCPGTLCRLAPHATARQCCVPDGAPCTTNQNCCSGQFCFTGTCQATGVDGGPVDVTLPDGGVSGDDGGCL